MPGNMTIGQLAKAAGVHVETIRYYQRRGLLTAPKRPLGGQRKYPVEALQRIHFIRRAQEVGFTLEEILGLIGMAARDDCEASCHAARDKLAELEQRMTVVTRMRREMRALVAACDARRPKEACPLIEYLSREAEGPRA
jgi:MerR family mercuric resistance operon transcriptional regulator